MDKIALKAKGLYNIAIGKVKKPDDEKLYEKWTMDDNECHVCVEVCYEKLKNLTQFINRIQRLRKLKMEGNEGIIKYISKVENLTKLIREMGDSMTDTAVITKIPSSLPDKYTNVCQAWLSTDESRQTIHNLTARLLDEEMTTTACEN
ncbi:hypothetical protein PR048_031766 [Dryococelus australis]|uniref:Uncharacterized protein n=1 Tax=Dryococelus australis TaxID=614101 RepID=A0ABQ9G900_9NEOP|nr:hypothetical protein PR048_031766 [Dryococelus australis]